MPRTHPPISRLARLVRLLSQVTIAAPIEDVAWMAPGGAVHIPMPAFTTVIHLLHLDGGWGLNFVCREVRSLG